MPVDAASIGVNAQRSQIRSVALLDCGFRRVVNADEWRYPPWWYNVLLALLEPVELDVVLALKDV